MRILFYHKLIITIFLLSFLSAEGGYAQLRKIKPENIELSNNLRIKYPKENVALLNSFTNYTFERFEDEVKGNLVVVNESANDEILAIKDNVKFENAVFYNAESEIKEIYVKKANGRRVPLNLLISDYTQDGIFNDDVKICSYNVNYEMRGEVIDFDSQKKYFDVRYLTTVFFHDRFPIKQKTISFEIPEWLDIELKEVNFEAFNIKKTITSDIKTKTKTYTYTVFDLSPDLPEKHAPYSSRIYPHILILSKRYTTNSGESVKLFGTVDDLYSWYLSLVKSIKEDNSVLLPTVNRLIENKKTDLEKIEAIFYWVQEDIRYIAFEEGIMGFKPESAMNVYKNKYGDCKGKANLLKQMLILAGFDARLSWIGTDAIPYDFSTPCLAINNHMICTVILKDKKYFLDATEEYIAINDYAHRIQDRQVLIEDGTKFILDKVPGFSAERNLIQTNIDFKLEGDVLKGKFSAVYHGEEKTELLRGYSAISSDNKELALKKYLSSNDKNIIIGEVKTSNMEDRIHPLELDYDFVVNNYVTHTNIETYLNIDTDKEFSSLVFDSLREKDYQFDNKVNRSTTIHIVIPEEYKIEYIPDSLVKVNPDFSFLLKYTIRGNTILYEKKITIDNAVIKKKDFGVWNDYVKQVRKFYKDQIVLVKKN